jgi:hypothetical protein
LWSTSKVGIFSVAALVVLPHGLVEAVVEVVELQVLELGLGGAEKLLAELDVAVHRAADVEEQQHLDRVAALGRIWMSR